jgi:cell division GTPase FtsZ
MGGSRYRCGQCTAQLAKEILTVVLTLPFLFEGKVRQEQAKIGRKTTQTGRLFNCH